MIERGPIRQQSRTTRNRAGAPRWLLLVRSQRNGSASLLGCSSPQRRNQRLAGSLLGLLALVELGWSGSSLLRLAPVESFLNTGPIGAALSGRESRYDGGITRSVARPTLHRSNVNFFRRTHTNQGARHLFR